MRTVRFGLVVGVVLLMAAPVFAQGGGGGGRAGGGGRGAGGLGGGMMGAAQPSINQILTVLVSPAAGLTDDEVKKASEIVAANVVQATALSKKGAYTAEQQGNLATAMAAVRGQTPAPTGQAYTDALNTELKLTPEQTKARADLTTLLASVLDQIKKALPAKADAIQTAYTAGGRGGMGAGRGAGGGAGGGGRGGRGGRGGGAGGGGA